jgi:hypothetical protein
LSSLSADVVDDPPKFLRQTTLPATPFMGVISRISSRPAANCSSHGVDGFG